MMGDEDDNKDDGDDEDDDSQDVVALISPTPKDVEEKGQPE